MAEGCSLIKWKKKLDKYRSEADDDALGIKGPRLVDTMQEPGFIMRDETNARAMRAMKMKQW